MNEAAESMVFCDEELRGHPTVLLIENALRNVPTFELGDNVDLLHRIVASDLPLSALKVALRKTLDDPDYQLPQFVMEGLIKGWTFLVTEYFAVSIGIRGTEASYQVPEKKIPPASSESIKIQPYPFDLYLGVIHTQQLQVDTYEVVELKCDGDDPEIAFRSKQQLNAGDGMFLRAGVDVTISQLQGTLIYVEITGRSKVRVLPQFDPVTHRFTGWISGNPMASRLELLTRVLADFDFKDGVQEIMGLTKHQDHYVRWNSIRHLLRLAPEEGIAVLHEAVTDAHPDVREVASLTLAHLGKSIPDGIKD